MSELGPNRPPRRSLDYASQNQKYLAVGSPIPSFILGILVGGLGTIFVILLMIGVLAQNTAFFVIAVVALAGVIYLSVKSNKRGAFIAGSICGFFLLVLLAGGVCFAILSKI